MPLTNDRSGALPLTCAGSPFYQSDVPGGGSSLSMKFPGTTYYTGSGAGLFAGIDFTNCELRFDAKPTAKPSFHVAVALGRYGAGCEFVYLSGTTWRYHVNGLGDRITGPAGSATLNQWQNVKLTRKGGVCSLYVNGTLLGIATDFPTPSNDLTIAAAKTGTGTPDGHFIGLLDNVRFASGSSGYCNAILNQLPPGASNQDMQPDADFDGTAQQMPWNISSQRASRPTHRGPQPDSRSTGRRTAIFPPSSSRSALASATRSTGRCNRRKTWLTGR